MHLTNQQCSVDTNGLCGISPSQEKNVEPGMTLSGVDDSVNIHVDNNDDLRK